MSIENGRVHPPQATPSRLGVAEVALMVLASVFGLVADWALRSRGITPTLADWARARTAFRSGPDAVRFGRDVALAAAPLALAWTLATLATLDGALRPWSRLVRRPGITPALVVVPAVAVAATLFVVGLRRHEPWTVLVAVARTRLVDAMAAGVAFGWMVLLRGRKWDPAPGWADRVGVGLGLFWIVAAVLAHAATLAARR